MLEMPDGLNYQPALPGVGVPDRSPLDMPSARARTVLQAAAVQLRNIVTAHFLETGRQDMATEAVADALEEISGGEVEAACEGFRSAAALWGWKA
jgi:hypothetical protein